MNINLNNYYDYFLMLVDNELSATDQEAVYNFLNENPDLVYELEQLKETVFIAEEIVMPNKMALLRHIELDVDNIGAEYKQMLLKIDGEIGADEQKELDLKLANNQLLNKEFNLLRSTILANEVILHPYKESLYRKEKVKIRPIVYIRWVAAAAVLIGFGVFGLLNKPKIEGVKTNEVVKEKPVQKKEAVKLKEAIDKLDEQPKVPANNYITKDKLPSLPMNNKVASPIKDNKPAPTVIIQQPLPEPIIAQIEPKRIDAVIINTEPQISKVEPTKNNVANVAIPSKVEPEIQNPLANRASVEGLNQDVQDEKVTNDYIRFAGTKVEKQKVRGLFRGLVRKVDRVFSKSKVEKVEPTALNTSGQ